MHHWRFRTLLVLICDVDLKLLQTKGWFAQSQGVVVYLSAVTSNHPSQQGGTEGYHWERPWQEAWSVQGVRHQHISNSCLSCLYIQGRIASNAANSLKPPMLFEGTSQITLTCAQVFKNFRHLQNFVAHLLKKFLNTNIYLTKVLNSKIFWFTVHQQSVCVISCHYLIQFVLVWHNY